MKTKIRLFQTENLGNILNLKNALKVLLLFFFTISSFGQNDGIEFTCTNFNNAGFDVTFSFEAPDGIDGDGFSTWFNGTDNFGGTGYTLLVEEDTLGNPLWFVRDANGDGYFLTPAFLGQSLPSCTVGWDTVDLGQSCESVGVECFGGSDPDNDEDGYPASVDCDDTNGAINPGATEVCDGVDNNCDGLIDDADPSVTGQDTWYLDADSDLHAVSTLTQCADPGVGYTLVILPVDDCNDAVDTIYPGAPEVIDDGIDQDCDGDDATLPYCNSQLTKVSVCHNGNITLCISVNALETHLDHGDTLGPCVDDHAATELSTDPFELISWPNPSDNYFSLILLNAINVAATIEIRVFDINGRMVFYKKGKANQVHQFGASLQAGLYFVNVTQDNETRQVKLIKY